MKKNNKIRSKVVKESLLDYNNLANTLKENTTSAVKDLLSEAVRDTYSKILTESDDDDDDDKDYDVEEVDDTDSGTDADNADNLTDDTDDSDVEGSDDADDDTDFDGDGDVDDVDSDSGVDDNGDLTGETTASGEDENGDEWSEFDKYKVSDGEYDLSNAEDDEIVKVYKLLNNDDQVIVNKTDDNKVSIKDNETGAEYLLDLGDDTDTAMTEDEYDPESDDLAYDSDSDFDDTDDDVDDDDIDNSDYDDTDDDADDDSEDYDDSEGEDNDDDDMNESRIYEIAINEYDSNLGYTDNYQNKDVLSTRGLSVADSKDSDDWGSKGLRNRGGSKPWSGKKNSASENQPFTGAKGKTVEEDDMPMDDSGSDGTMTESAGEMGAKMGAHARMTGTKFHANNNRTRVPYVKHHVSRAGEYVGDEDGTQAENESIRRKANKIFAENKELKNALGKFKNVLKEAAVTNVNLGQIIKLISENTTSQDEKKEIIARFGKEAKTVQQSKNLYEAISRDLQKKGKLNINEDRQFGVNGSKQINETQIYQSQDLLESLDLMHKICK